MYVMYITVHGMGVHVPIRCRSNVKLCCCLQEERSLYVR